MVGIIWGSVSALIAGPPAKNKYQDLADEMVWDWPKDKAHLKYCCEHYKGAFELENEEEGEGRETLVTFKDKEGKKVFSFLAHNQTVFVESNNIVYYANYTPHSTGCTLIAYDLKAGKELWKTGLKGLGRIAHFQYHNAVALDIKEGALRILGNEAAGQYVEFVDMKTGKTVGHKVFKKDP